MIGSSENRISYNGNGIATEFAYTFKILEKSNLKVLHVAADGTEELLTTDYYVDMEKSVVLYPGYAPGAEIPEQNRPPILPVGERLVLYREVPITQESALDKHWPFNVIENGLDKLTIICQQIWDRLQRSFYVSESTSSNFDPKVPIEAGKTFRVKDDGTGFEVTEDPGKVIDGATALLERTTEQANIAVESSTNAQNAANVAEAVAPEYAKTKEVLDNIVSYTNTATEKASIATAKANAANVSAVNAAQSYANADAIAAQLTEYLATKENLTAPAVDKTLLIEGAAADSKIVGELDTRLSESIAEILPLAFESVKKTYGRNLFDKDGNLINKKYIATNGVIADATDANYYVSDFIKVDAEALYCMNGNCGAGNIACYDATRKLLATPTVSTTYADGCHQFTTPSGCEYIRITLLMASYNPTIDKWIVEKGNKIHEYESFTDKDTLINAIKIPYGIKKTALTLNTNQAIYFDVPNVKSGNVITFDATIASYNFIQIRHGLSTPYSSSAIRITNTDVILMDSADADSGLETIKGEFKHGLTIADHITVIIDCYAIDKCKLTITVPSGQYVKDLQWEGCRGMVYAQSSSTLTNVTFGFYCNAYNRDIWAYGDSYFDMWTVVAEKMGFSNCLFDGWGGRTSTEAYASLKLALLEKKPKAILWCLGMNDPDSTNINENWKLVFDELKEYCNANKIKLIAVTIPNTPSHLHTYKNAYIKASGVMYIDVAEALGASEAGSHWYDGLINVDNIHPSYEMGRQVIASKIISSLPELLDERRKVSHVTKLEHIADVDMTDEVNEVVYRDGVIYVRYQGTINSVLTNGKMFLKIGSALYPNSMGTRLGINGELNWASKIFFIGNNQGNIFTTGTVESDSRISFAFSYYLGERHYSVIE